MANASFGVNIIPKNNTVTIGNSGSPWTIVSPSLTGVPTAPTATVGTHTTQIATTEFVENAKPAVMIGATSSVDGSSGLVPAPVTTERSKFLRGDGTWASVDEKADKVSSATNGDLAALDSNGNLTDSGKKVSDFILASTKGANNGVAELDPYGKVPASQLPSYVDDVVEANDKDFSTYSEWASGTNYTVGTKVKVTSTGKGYKCKVANHSTIIKDTEWDEMTRFPATGETDKIYVATNTNLSYRWGGSTYVMISNDLALGETQSTAYRGDRGAAAYAAAVTNKTNSVTSGDSNLVTSDGVHTALLLKADKQNPVLTGSISMGRTDGTTVGNSSTALGFMVEAPGTYAHAEGNIAKASGLGSHAEGQGTTASGDQSHAEGSWTTASGIASHSENGSTIASGVYSHAEGSGTNAFGTQSHAEGAGTTASGRNSHAEGDTTTAIGAVEHVSGQFNVLDTAPAWVANTSYNVGDLVSRAESYTDASNVTRSYTTIYKCKTANNDATFTALKWTVSGQYLEAVGNGTANNARSNARTLDWDGNERLMGNIYVGCNSDSTGGTMLNPNEYTFNEQAVLSAVKAVTNVTHCAIKVNHANVAVDGLAAKSIHVLSSGGTKANVAAAIYNSNTSGLATVGSLSATVDGQTISFSRPTLLAVSFYITIKGFSTLDLTTLGDTIKTNIGAYVNNLDIAEPLYCSRIRDIVIAAIGANGVEYAIDVSCGGAHGTERNCLTPAWNEKYTMVTPSNDVTVVSSEFSTIPSANGVSF